MLSRKKTQIVVKDMKLPLDKSVYDSIRKDIPRALKKIEDYDWDNSYGSPIMYIQTEVIQPLKFFAERAYQPIEVDNYMVAYKSFCEIITELNKYMVYTPTPIDFCRYISISKRRFDKMRNEQNEIGDILSQINDLLSNNVMHNMMAGRIKEISGIFILKASYGLRDTDPANTNILNVSVQTKTTDEILAELEKLGI